MSKNARWGQQAGSPTVVLAVNDENAQHMLGGKTLAQVGAEFDLFDEDVKWGFSTNPKNGEEIRTLVLHIENKHIVVPISRQLTDEMMDNPEILTKCMFRKSFLSVKNDDGTPKMVDGQIVLNEQKPYFSFGRPSGIVIERLENAFGEPVAAGSSVATA